MNKLFAILAATVALAVSSVVFAEGKTVAAAATEVTKPTLPSKLEGRWATPDNRFGQSWSVSDIDVAAKSARVTWWGRAQNSCSAQGAPAILEYDGVNLKISVAKYGCMDQFVAQLARSGAVFTGEIRMNIGGGPYPFVIGTIK